jgi:hypothetical protein
VSNKIDSVEMDIMILFTDKKISRIATAVAATIAM